MWHGKGKLNRKDAGEVNIQISHIEISCAKCGTNCVNSNTGYETLVSNRDIGKHVMCTKCNKEFLIDEKFFKKTKKKTEAIKKEDDKKSGRGRKLLGNAPRKDFTTTLDEDTIKALREMPENTSQLIEKLLRDYRPFVETLQRIQNDDNTTDDV